MELQWRKATSHSLIVLLAIFSTEVFALPITGDAQWFFLVPTSMATWLLSLASCLCTSFTGLQEHWGNVAMVSLWCNFCAVTTALLLFSSPETPNNYRIWEVSDSGVVKDINVLRTTVFFSDAVLSRLVLTLPLAIVRLEALLYIVRELANLVASMQELYQSGLEKRGVVAIRRRQVGLVLLTFHLACGGLIAAAVLKASAGTKALLQVTSCFLVALLNFASFLLHSVFDLPTSTLREELVTRAQPIP